MNAASRGWVGVLVFAGLVLGVLSIAVVGGFAIADEQPSGEAILTEVESTYENADSTIVEATIVTEHDGELTTFAVHTVATKSGQMRVNVSNDSGYVVVGTDGNVTWVTGTEMEAPLILRNDGVQNSTPFIGANLNGTDVNLSASALGNESNFTEMQGTEAMRNESLSTHLKENGMHATDYEALLSEHNGTHFNKTTFGQYDRTNWSVSRVLEETNLTAERVDSVTEDGQDLHVVVISAPEEDGQLKLWVSAHDWTIEKEELTTPNGTVTVEMDTRFNVSPAASTFQPPSPFGNEQAIDSIDELRIQSASPLAVPGENWTFSQGSVLDRPVSLTAAQYTDANRNLTVVQSESTAISGLAGEGRTINVTNRTVTISDLSKMESDMDLYGMGDGVIAQWTETDQTIVVAGNLTESQLVETIESIEVDRSDS